MRIYQYTVSDKNQQRTQCALVTGFKGNAAAMDHLAADLGYNEVVFITRHSTNHRYKLHLYGFSKNQFDSSNVALAAASYFYYRKQQLPLEVKVIKNRNHSKAQNFQLFFSQKTTSTAILSKHPGEKNKYSLNEGKTIHKSGSVVFDKCLHQYDIEAKETINYTAKKICTFIDSLDKSTPISKL